MGEGVHLYRHRGLLGRRHAAAVVGTCVWHQRGPESLGEPEVPGPRRRRHGHVAGPDRAPCGPREGQADPKSLSVTGNPTRTGSERGRERGREVVGLKRREAGTAGTDCGVDAVTWAGCPHGTSSREKDKEETVFSCRRPRKGPWQVAWAARWVNGSQRPCPLRASTAPGGPCALGLFAACPSRATNRVARPPPWGHGQP